METLTSSQRFLNACWQKPVDTTPVWFMRQAGRFLSEYRAIRAHHTLLEICAQPELAAQVTLQPVTRLGVDAAILFADILLPLVPMGIQLEFAAGEGPVIHNPIRSAADVAALRPVEPRESLANVLAAIRIVRKELDGTTALIGFAGAPFTLASYLIEGGSSRNLLKTKRMMYSDPQSWRRLMEKLAQVIADYLSAQIDAGAQAVQLFDSWVGTLTPDDYREYGLPYSKSIFAALQNKGVPTIHFGTGTASLLPLMKEAGGNVIGIDWQTPLDWAWKLLDHQVAVQGNLDPVAFYAPEGELEKRVERVLRQAGGRPGHIFNLGHGILPDTPVDQVKRVVDLVHEWSYQPVE
ncbi:MAG: uroporphyrinogen decarboxylase [Chloroflexi bacterium GWB2_54_36]|nr:MAG: uroporphyrinogen decarboxylase [Chloroflexi bacterium GWB2_54_36]HBA91835.1 uroporphyrinogen decarboxylase [Anaerolineaceae bacterium]